jgi:hypothetical protein
VTAYPWAFRRAFYSLYRERVSGILEQLCLTSLRPDELFEGKYYGVLAPFYEMRRYMIVYVIIFCVSSIALGGWRTLIGSVTISLFAINHFGYSAQMGVLAGLKAGCKSSKLLNSLMTEWELNPWLNHLMFIVSNRLAIMTLCIALFCYFASMIFGIIILAAIGRAVIALLLILVCFIPFVVAYRLQDHERSVRDQMRKTFKKMIAFEAVK